VKVPISIPLSLSRSFLAAIEYRDGKVLQPWCGSGSNWNFNQSINTKTPYMQQDGAEQIK